LEAANKNFILLEHKFGGVLSEALLAQNDSPLSYGSEFKPIDDLQEPSKLEQNEENPHSRI
jgi:hypothetical protein